MVASHRRSEYLDLPDRPKSPIKLDQVLGRGSTRWNQTSVRAAVDHTRSTQEPSRRIPDHLPTHISTSTRSLLDLLDAFQISTRSTRPTRPILDLYPISTRLIPDYVRSRTIAARQLQTRYKNCGTFSSVFTGRKTYHFLPGLFFELYHNTYVYIIIYVCMHII